MLVCTLGDLTLDVIVRLSEPIAVGGDTAAEISLAPGGQAANVAAWAATLGASARLIGKTGDDDAGAIARSRLAALGVDVQGPVHGRNGMICSLVTPEGERSMVADRGSARELRPDEVDPAWLVDCDHLFVSGYALFGRPAQNAARRAVDIARSTGSTVSVDLASWSTIRDFGADELRSLVSELAPDVVLANEDEAHSFGDPLEGVTWILKRGAQGVVVDGEEHPAHAVEDAVDPTGAGDAFAAGWIVGGVSLGLEAASRCVRQVGATPVASAQ